MKMKSNKYIYIKEKGVVLNRIPTFSKSLERAAVERYHIERMKEGKK